MTKYYSSNRANDYFVEQVVENPEQSMKNFCLIADQIYKIHNEKGKEGLQVYLVNVIGIDRQLAERISNAYIGKNAPENIDIQKHLLKGNWDSIIPKLSLRLNSRLIWPKNILVWEIIKFLKGDGYFAWEIIGKSGKNWDNKIVFDDYPIAEDGKRIPIELVALDVVHEGEIPYHIKKKAELILNSFDRNFAVDLIKTFMQSGMLFPPKKIVKNFIEVLKKGMKGEEIILTSCVCPDYSYVKKDHINRTNYEYTFQSLGGGIGLVAKQVQRMSKAFDEFFQKYSIKYKFVMSIADYEANEKNCELVGETRSSFMKKCKNSLITFEQSLTDVPIISRMFQDEWAFGRWKDSLEYCEREIKKGNFGMIKDATGKDAKSTLSFISKDSANFYRRWYPGITDDEIYNLVIEQAAEYAASSMIMANDFKGTGFIQLAGDRPKMNIFNNFASLHPTICAERVY